MPVSPLKAASLFVLAGLVTPIAEARADNSLAHSMRLWRDVYQVDAAVPVGWTSKGGANGTASEAYRNATLSRINYFRSMAGLAGVARDATMDRNSQEAAVMMSAAGKLSHTPTNDGTWPYFTNDGVTGAGSSSLSLGSTGPNAVDDFMDDSSGYGLGHRRYVLNPTRTKAGIGIAAAPGYASSLAEGNLDFSGTRPSASSKPFVAWPSAGYVPYQTTNNFWSISINHDNADTDVTGATVVLKQGNTTLPVSPIAGEAHFGQAEWYADPTVAFTSSSFTGNAPAAPTTYSVTVANVKIGGVTQSPYSYSVTLFDPAKYKLAPGLAVSEDPNVANSDFNHDGQITFDDLVILAQHYNTTYNFDNLTALAQNYNRTYPILIASAREGTSTAEDFGQFSPEFQAAFALAVPEPTTLAAFTAAGVLLRRRR